MTVGQDAEYPPVSEMESYLRDRCRVLEDLLAQFQTALGLAVGWQWHQPGTDPPEPATAAMQKRAAAVLLLTLGP